MTAGLGCSNGCDFCCTSHFFNRKYVPFAKTGRDVYDGLMATEKRAAAEGVQMNGFVLIDEDFFLHHKRAREFLDCVREGGKPLSLMGFGSVRGLSQFTAREVAEMGFDLVWNAFEGTNAGYRKQQGKTFTELYADLKSVGCAQLTSMIIGFPYQDEAQVWREVEELMRLEPGLTQCLIYFAFPGTPFHEQVIAEGRYLDRYRDKPDLRRWDGFAMHFEHPKFDGPEQIEKLQRAIYDADFRRLGPSPLRLARVWLTGWENLRNDVNPLLQQRAERLRREARGVLPVCAAAIAFGPSAEVRQRARDLRSDIIRLTGALSAQERVMEARGPVMYTASAAARALGILQQPGLLRTEHRIGTSDGARADEVFRLQRPPLARALVEDLVEHARRLVRRARPIEGRPEHRVVTNAALQKKKRVSLPLLDATA